MTPWVLERGWEVCWGCCGVSCWSSEPPRAVRKETLGVFLADLDLKLGAGSGVAAS